MANSQDIGTGPESSRLPKDRDSERKQRSREYRIAARREKRNRKGDEKRQRKLNATILRRMTRNPDKYNKNAERNRFRDIESERRKIWHEAVRQAQRLAAIHDPSGATFNVDPVVLQEDGSVISKETLRRRQERALEKVAAEQAKGDQKINSSLATLKREEAQSSALSTEALLESEKGLNPDRRVRTEALETQKPNSRLSKSKKKKRAAFEPQPPPPRPIIPESMDVPEGEENWLALWDLPDDQLERRVLREKRRKAAERKALRLKQRSGKAERRAARDERRAVYRDMKLTWKSIKEEQVRERTLLKSIEDEESKKIAVDINIMERKAALDHCAALGFTPANTPGVEDIKPRALGMKGVEVDFDAIEIGESQSDVKLKHNHKRVNLGDAPKDINAEYVPTGPHDADDEDEEGDVEEYIKLDVGEGQDFKTLNYNHKLRRKLRKAIDNAEIRKEMLIRQRALDYYHEQHVEAPSELKTSYKPINVRGKRILENGSFETSKQERVRARIELTEFNTQMRVLRTQAKDSAIFAGLRKHAELTGRIPTNAFDTKQEKEIPVPQADNLKRCEGSPTAVYLRSSYGCVKRSRDSDGLSSSASSDQSGNLPYSSIFNLHNYSANPMDERSETKRYKVGSRVINNQSESTNRDRQAMIDAESALSTGIQQPRQRDEKLGNGSGPQKDVYGNEHRKIRSRSDMGKAANSLSTWNVGSLPGDNARKGKFLRLLGGEKSTSVPNGGDLYNSHSPAGMSARIDAELERQYHGGVTYKKDSKRKGLGW